MWDMGFLLHWCALILQRSGGFADPCISLHALCRPALFPAAAFLSCQQFEHCILLQWRTSQPTILYCRCMCTVCVECANACVCGGICRVFNYTGSAGLYRQTDTQTHTHAHMHTALMLWANLIYYSSASSAAWAWSLDKPQAFVKLPKWQGTKKDTERWGREGTGD